jgi:hypothetical protein
MHCEVANRFPRRPANRLFLALALLDLGNAHEAVAEALRAALINEADPDIVYYQRALTAYADQLVTEGKT